MDQIKKAIILILILSLTLGLSGCKKEKSLGEQLRESQQKLDEARQKEKEAKEKERELQMLYDTLKDYENSH